MAVASSLRHIRKAPVNRPTLTAAPHNLAQPESQEADPINPNIDAEKMPDPHGPLTRGNIMALQRTLGNQAVQRLIRQRQEKAVPKEAVVAATARIDPGVIQRMVGFEFEAQWNVREKATKKEDKVTQELYKQEKKSLVEPQLRAMIKQKFNLKTEQEITKKLKKMPKKEVEKERNNAYMVLLSKKAIGEAPLPGKNLSKLGKVVEAKDFDLTADTSPSGGAQLEWVTDPLTTREQLETVMTNIESQGTALNTRKGQPVVEAKMLDGIGTGHLSTETDTENMMIYPQGEQLFLAPQVTSGFKMANVAKMMKYISDNLGANQHLMSTAQASSDAPRLDNALNEAKKVVTDLETLLDDLPDEAKTASRGELQSLLTLMANYLLNGAELGKDANSKSIAGRFMARTDFVSNFNLIPKPLQIYFQGNPKAFEMLVLKAAKMEGKGDEKIFPRGFEKGMAGQRKHYDLEVTRGQWARWIALMGQDLLRNYEEVLKDEGIKAHEEPSPETEGMYQIHKSLGGLGRAKEDDRVGPDKVEPLIMELRGMKDNKKVPELKPLALAVYDFIEIVNATKAEDDLPEDAFKAPKKDDI